ncbi:MAG: tRNA preQ1(34) S-adenosylmethionine ribosyltransferase-isomerase QueA [Pyrinomonadaceae bacterium]|nr:tRNA preQ1(34) S-adenosylmethionine ribosyltransferase-isomerase QueA [Pyrinomonadaceae bacterium]
MHISAFDFELPKELIADEPLEERAASRMLVVDRGAACFDDSQFERLPELLLPTDLLVVNNTRVFPARLLGRSDTGASVEIFLVSENADGTWLTLAKPAKRLKPGRRVVFDEQFDAVVEDRTDDGRVIVRFGQENVYDHFERIGRTPLPPYIKRDPHEADSDRERYQTVYARERGAIAAPTAGLHFTPAILDRIRERGINIAEVTLHVGYGTFEPVRAEDLSQHTVSPERYEISAETAEMLNEAKCNGRRIIAVGTTTTRTLENALANSDSFAAGSGYADLTIRPGYGFKAIDGLLTNFHLPKSSLLVLVSTFAGRELIMRAYRHAVEERYRFYSYGDCMFIS